MQWSIDKHNLVKSYNLLNPTEVKIYHKDGIENIKSTASTFSKQSPVFCAWAITISGKNKHMAIGFLDGKTMIRNMDKQLTIKKCLFDA